MAPTPSRTYVHEYDPHWRQVLMIKTDPYPAVSTVIEYRVHDRWWAWDGRHNPPLKCPPRDSLAKLVTEAAKDMQRQALRG